MASERQDPPTDGQPIKSELGLFFWIRRSFMARKPVPKNLGQPSKTQNGGSK